MLLRKINAVSSLLCAVFLFAHAILQAVTMLSMGSITVNASVPAWILAGCMALHAFMFPSSSYPISYRGYFDDYKSDAKEEKENV